MTVEQIQELEKAVAKARFALSQKAGALHDLIEDRLPVDYHEIPSFAEETYNACVAWDKLNKELIEVKKNS